MPPKRIVVLLNGSARALAQQDAVLSEARVAEAFASAGLGARISVCSGEALRAAARAAAAGGADVVVAGGGDGTVSTAAGELAGSDVPLGVLPLGTLNHFARDLGLPEDLGEAARVIAAGHVRSVDLGDVNGHVFLNNSSIGLYPEVVEGREELRERSSLGKWPAMLYAAAGVLRRFPLFTLTIEAAGGRATLRTPFVFVGNNAYELRLFALGRRQALDAGTLSVYVSTHQTRAGLVGLAARTVLARLDQDRDFRSFTLTSLRIDSRRRTLRVSADGEVLALAPPVSYGIRRGALRVVAPAA